MTTPKNNVIKSIEKAKTDLESALENLEYMPAFDVDGLGYAAHVLHNYLTVIEGTTELLMMSLEDHPDENIQSWLKGLRHATKMMDHTANQLMSGATTGESSLLFVKTDLPLLVRRVCNYYKHIADRKNILINYKSLAITPYVCTDPVALSAALDNLMSNAIKFSKPEKKVFVEVTQELSHLICRVKDQGPGLTFKEQQKLFQRGAKLGPRPTAGEPSTGYGLAVAKDLISRLGGEIWCESEPEEGSIFSIRLPLYQEEADEFY